MTRVKKLSRFLILLLAAVMALGSLLSPVSAVDIGKGKTEFGVTIHVEDTSTAGTDGDVYFVVKYIDGKTEQKLMDKEHYNDFEQDDTDTYYMTFNKPYWYFEGFEIKNTGSNAMCIDWVEIKVFPDAGSKSIRIISRDPYQYWIDKDRGAYKITIDQNSSDERSRRQVLAGSSAYNAFKSAFSGTRYLNDGDSGKVVVNWVPSISNDGIYTGNYNPYRYETPPSFEYAVYAASDKSVDGSGWQEVTSFKKLFTAESDSVTNVRDKTVSYISGYSYKADEVLTEMTKSNYYALKIVTKLAFDQEGLDSKKCFDTAEYYIYRRQFEMGKPEVTSAYFPAGRDQNFFNSSHSRIEFRISALTGPRFANCSYNGPTVGGSFVDPELLVSKAYLYYGPGDNDYLEGRVSSNYPDMTVSFNISDVEYETLSGSGSLKLLLKGVQLQLPNGELYKLWDQGSFRDGKPREESLPTGENGVETLGYGAYYCELSEFKLDTVAPEAILHEKDYTLFSGQWKQSATLVTSVKNDEQLFPDSNIADPGYFRMQLYDGANPIPFRYMDNGSFKNTGTEGILVPVLGGKETVVSLPSDQEYGSLTVRLTGRDFAGNPLPYTAFTGLKLDTLAPAVDAEIAYARSPAADGSLSANITFAIREGSGTGRINYCFLPKGDDLKSVNEQTETSEIIGDLVGKWAFVYQDPKNGSLDKKTVILTVKSGESFEGTLYYRGVDAAGNESPVTGIPVGIHDRSVISVAPYTHPMPDYDISFTPEAGCEIYYRYATPTADGQDYYRRPYELYDPQGPNPGSSLVKAASASGGTDYERLNGPQILEYKIVDAVYGSETVFEGPMGEYLVFDNAVPELRVTRLTTGSSLEAHSFSLAAADASGIASARYEIRAVGSTEAAASGELEIVEGAERLNMTLSTYEMGLGNGAYTFTLFVADRNGDKAELTSDPFSIRNQPPAAEITIDGEEPAAVTILNDPRYTLELRVSEAYAGAGSGQSVFWRASANGNTFTSWTRLTGMTAGSGALTAEGTLDTPVALHTGMNQVYLQLLCAETGKDPNKDAISAGSILSLAPVQFLLDTTAPTVRWSASCGRNNTALTGTVTVGDDLSAAPAVTCDVPGVTLTRSQESDNTYALEYVTDPAAQVGELTVLVTDEAGNVTVLKISTELLDLEGPAIRIGSPDYETFGERQDAVITVTVIEDHPGAVNFLLEPDAERYSIVRDEGDGVYTLRLRGYTGSQPFTVEAADDLGNRTSAVSGAIEVIDPAIAEPEILSQPAYAQESAPVVLRFNVPAAAAATEEAALEEAQEKAGLGLTASCVLVPDAGGEGKQACTVWVADEFGRTARFTLRPEVFFGMRFPLYLALEQYTDGVKAPGDPDVLVAGRHVADPSNSEDTEREYTARVVVEPYPLYTEDGGIYRADGWGMEYAPWADEAPSGRLFAYDEAGDRHPVDRLDTGAFMVDLGSGDEELHAGAIAVFPYTILPAGDERTGDRYAEDGAVIDYFDGEDYDDKGRLLRFLPDWPDTAFDLGGVSHSRLDSGYWRMAFAVENDGSLRENLSSAKLNVGLVSLSAWSDGSEQDPDRSIYIRSVYTVSDDTRAHTLRFSPGGADIWINQTLTLGCPVITVQPEISYSCKQNTIAPEVELNASAGGCGAEIVLLKILRQEADGSWTAAAVWAPDAESSGPNLSYIVEEDEAGFYRVYAENEYGLSSISEAFEIVVFSDPISEEDYDLTVSAFTGDALVPLTGEEVYALYAQAELSFTAAGKERGLHAVNTGKLTVRLTPEDHSFTFRLADDYGYTRDVSVSYSKFDVTSPALSYELTVTEKTNQPFDVIIAARDGESGIGLVSLSGPGGEEIDLRSGDEGWLGRIERSGSYLITAEDLLGNRTLRTFTVTNIDTDAPEVTLSRSVPEGVWTQGIVTVTLNFNKPNVTITRVEKTSGRFNQNKAAGKLTFMENGAASVFFRDDHGNEGSVLVTVNNIYSEPPHLVAVPRLSEDELSVLVTFEQERDAQGVPLDFLRDLSEMTVLHNGVAYRADEAVFVLRDNGDYTFTVVDQVGLMQIVKLTVTDIDRSAPRITEVRWSYAYLDSDGTERNATYRLSTVEGAGYRIADDIYPRTNRDVTVVVTTDKPTAYVGSSDRTMTTEHALVYHDNGLFVYTLEKQNGLVGHYGVDVEIIDKTPPEIILARGNFLMYVEGRDKGSVREELLDFTARDEYLGEMTDLTGQVTVDFGSFDPDELENNTFDKSAPYEITYTVRDAAGNETQVTRTVVLVGINDVLVTVNGILPNASFMAESRTGTVVLELVNFSGAAYASYAPDMRTFGQMKTMGKLIPQVDGAFRVEGLKKGWYTFFVQTELRDYFNIYVYVN